MLLLLLVGFLNLGRVEIQCFRLDSRFGFLSQVLGSLDLTFCWNGITPLELDWTILGVVPN